MPDARIEIEVEDGCLDAFVASPDCPGRQPPVLLLANREGVTPAVEQQARRLAGHGYFVLAPEWPRRGTEDRREDADAWLDHLADEPRVHDERVGVVGWGLGANLALRLAAWRSERIAAAATYGGRGFGPATAREIAQRINGVVRIGYVEGVASPRMGFLEAAFCEAGVNFDIEVVADELDWPGLVDLFGRVLQPVVAAGSSTAAYSGVAINP
jgi:carboxymethylenebutenolidase